MRRVLELPLWQGVLLLCLLGINLQSYSQTSKKKVKLIHTDELVYEQEILDAQRLLGNVHLEYQGTHFYCDSAYLFANDDFDAFSKIRIVEPDGYNVNGDFLHFDNQKSTATLRNNIVLRDNEMTLTTNNLIYDLKTEIAVYSGGGKIVSSANQNTLTSERGIYHARTEEFFFRKNVVLKNPDYTVKCDTMQYNDLKEVTYFLGPTYINGDKTSIYCENGSYNTKKDQSRFGRNAEVWSETTVLRGDSIFYDGNAGLGEVFRNVSIRDTTESYIITGNYGRHHEKLNESIVTDGALLIQVFDGDSLYMHADTLRSMPDTSGNDVVYAYHGVKIFKQNLQGKCDSLVYSKSDSTMHMYHEPVLWSMQSQVTGDSISIGTAHGRIERLFVRGNAFMISDAEAKGDSIKGGEEKFNQIKGRRMTGVFENNELSSIYVEGNGQVIYFPADEKGERPKAIGHNKGECSNIMITIKENELKRIRLETETNSLFTPMKLTDKSTFLLEDFLWLADKRPRSLADILN